MVRLGLDFDSLKKKMNETLEASAQAISEGLEVAKDAGQKAAKVALSVTGDLSREASIKVLSSDISDKAKNRIIESLDTVSETCDNIQEILEQPKKLMEHKILMMGGRRAGKSTILSGILSQLREKTPGDICTIIDTTDYTQMIVTDSGEEIPLPTLDIKQNEIKRYISKRAQNTEFLVDMTPTYGKASYILQVSSDNTSVELEFVDVPGEWMRANVKEHKSLVELIESSDVFVIAIDTPFLMNTNDEEGKGINKVYNRINEITQAMTHLKINTENDLKQIILCPIKCEKWVCEGKFDDVVEKLKQSYKDLINRWVNCPEVTIQIMPIQTVGGFESSRMLPAKLYFDNEEEPIGISCSEDPLTHLLRGTDGTVIRQREGSRVEDDKAWLIDYFDIPLSWYKLNGRGYSPQYCEQPGYHILNFLVSKEEKVNKAKADAERKKLEDSNPIWRFFKIIFNPTFGKYLPIWRNVINKLNSRYLIKTDGDGFCYVRKKIL